jgi:hypothetical protein
LLGDEEEKEKETEHVDDGWSNARVTQQIKKKKKKK